MYVQRFAGVGTDRVCRVKPLMSDLTGTVMEGYERRPGETEDEVVCGGWDGSERPHVETTIVKGRRCPVVQLEFKDSDLKLKIFVQTELGLSKV